MDDLVDALNPCTVISEVLCSPPIDKIDKADVDEILSQQAMQDDADVLMDIEVTLRKNTAIWNPRVSQEEKSAKPKVCRSFVLRRDKKSDKNTMADWLEKGKIKDGSKANRKREKIGQFPLIRRKSPSPPSISESTSSSPTEQASTEEDDDAQPQSSNSTTSGTERSLTTRIVSGIKSLGSRSFRNQSSRKWSSLSKNRLEDDQTVDSFETQRLLSFDSEQPLEMKKMPEIGHALN